MIRISWPRFRRQELAAPAPQDLPDLVPFLDLPSGYARLADRVTVSPETFDRVTTDAASLRAELDDRNGEVAELTQALDRRRPAPRAEDLAAMLRGRWYAPSAYALDTDARWLAVAETAIDHVRGLWPLEEQMAGAAIGACTMTDYVADAVIHGAECEPLQPCTCGADDDQTARDRAEVGAALDDAADQCGRAMAVFGTFHDREPLTVTGGSGEANLQAEPRAGAPSASGDATLAAESDAVLERLAEVLGQRDMTLCGTGWSNLHDRLRDHYRNVAGDVILAGWRPPLADLSTPSRVALVGEFLHGHHLTGQGMPTCQCGWDGLEVFHAEHVATELLGLGVPQ